MRLICVSTIRGKIHYLDQVTVTELIGDVPTEAENNDDMIKMTTNEESR